MNASSASAPAFGLPVRRSITLPRPPCTSGVSFSASACRAGGRFAAAILSDQAFAASVAPMPPRTAIPSAPPTWRDALITPEATPALAWSTAPIAVAADAGIVEARPMPSSIWNGQIAL